MAKYIIDGATLSSIADSIRVKKGTTANIAPENMPTEIASIETGGGGGELDDLLTNKLTALDSDVTSIRQYAFRGATALTSVNLPKATSVATNAFYGCSKMTSYYFPSVKSIADNVFCSNGALLSVNCPSLTSIGTYSFRECYKLDTVDFAILTSIPANLFYNCRRLKAVVLRSATMCTLANTNAFTNCRHIHGTVDSTYNPNGDKDCYIYVPSALVDSYKAATNWTTFASQFRVLEDYTVDGTTTGALDESKR